MHPKPIHIQRAFKAKFHMPKSLHEICTKIEGFYLHSKHFPNLQPSQYRLLLTGSIFFLISRSPFRPSSFGFILLIHLVQTPSGSESFAGACGEGLPALGALEAAVRNCIFLHIILVIAKVDLVCDHNKILISNFWWLIISILAQQEFCVLTWYILKIRLGMIKSFQRVYTQYKTKHLLNKGIGTYLDIDIELCSHNMGTVHRRPQVAFDASMLIPSVCRTQFVLYHNHL